MLYELIFLVRRDVSQAQAMVLAERFKGVLEENGAAVPKVEYCGLRSLAYKVKKNKKAHYLLLNIDGPSKALDEVGRQMRFHEDVLRHLLVKVEELDPNPSYLAQSRYQREGWAPATKEVRTSENSGGETAPPSPEPTEKGDA